MNIKAQALCLLVVTSCMQPLAHAMKREDGTRTNEIVQAAVGLSVCAAAIYLLPRILALTENDNFIETNNAQLYKKPNTREYAILITSEEKIILHDIKIRPLMGLGTDELVIQLCPGLTSTMLNEIKEKYLCKLREMQLVKTLANENQKITINLARRNLQHIIDEYEASTHAVIS